MIKTIHISKYENTETVIYPISNLIAENIYFDSNKGFEENCYYLTLEVY